MDTTQEAGKSSADVYLIAPKDVKHVWEQVQAFVAAHEASLWRYSSPEHVFNSILKGNIDLWLGIDQTELELVAFTTLYGDTEKYVDLFWMGGNHFAKYKEIGLDKIEKWCAIQGAPNLVIGGRRGWERELRDSGFKFHRVEMVKPVRYMVMDQKSGELGRRH